MRSELRELGERIRSIRQSRGFSQEKLAELSGLHRTYIGGVERGERNISVLNLVLLAKTLRVKVGDLFEKGKP